MNSEYVKCVRGYARFLLGMSDLANQTESDGMQSQVTGTVERSFAIRRQLAKNSESMNKSA